VNAVLSRREFLAVTTTAAGGLMASLTLPAGGETPRLSAIAQLGVFVRIDPDPKGRVVIGARGCEIGQGVRTSLPMLIAEELDVAWSQVTVEQLPYGLLPSDQPPGVTAKYGPQGAGGSTSIPEAWTPLRQAGAAVRWMLIQAAAKRWSADAASLRTDQGRVLHPDGRALTYGELAYQAATLTPPKQDLPLKDPKEFRIIGRATGVADARAIVTGRAAYGLDGSWARALTAVIARCPWFDGDIESVDDTATRRIPGVRAVVRIPAPKRDAAIDRNLAAGVAVVADDFWTALKGRDALVVKWRPGPWAADSTEALAKRAHALVDAGDRAQGLAVARSDGDLASARSAAAKVVEARYTEPFLAHATLEPPGALIDLRGDRAVLVASLQSPGGASRLISAMTGLPRLAINISLPRSGGGFGRRLENDFVAEAVYVAQAAKAPVKLAWTREDDLSNDFYRPFGVHALAATLDARGRVTGWSHRVVATARKWRASGMEDADAWVGCADPDGFPAGCVANYRADFAPVDFGLARGWWRAPLPTFAAFPVQCFVDEVAAAARRDPLELRLEMLGAPRELDYRDHGGPKLHTGRLAGVLRKAASAIGYGRQLPAGRGIGLAAHFTFGGYAAHAIEVEARKGESPRVRRAVVAVDVGQVVNPLGLEAQMIGGTIDGLSTALNLGITVRDGRIEQRNFNDYALLRMADAPDVEVHIVPSTAPPAGAGEMGIPTAAPALANAIHAASGLRIRDLPMRSALAARSSS
jgi:isoquinoline 1-oxidoreductase subunit beta